MGVNTLYHVNLRLLGLCVDAFSSLTYDTNDIIQRDSFYFYVIV